VRGGDYVTHIHLDTGNNAFFDQYFGADSKFVKLEANGNIVINADDGANSESWTFGTDGNLTLPDTATIVAGNGIRLEANSDSNTSGIQVYGDADANVYAHSNVVIYTDSNGTGNTWVFGTDGNLTVPGGGAVWTLGAGTAGLTANFADPYAVNLGLDYTTNTATLAGATSVVIQSNTGANTNQWNFDATGNLTVPGNIIVTTGIVASALASPAPYLSGFDSLSAVYISASGNINGDNLNATANITAGNVVTTGSGGDITMTGGNITGANIVSANTFVSNAFNVVTAGNLSITSQYGLGFTGTILEDNGTLELIANGGGGVVLGWDSTYGNGLGNIATVNFNEVGGGEGNILLRTGNRSATEYNWNFDSTGNLTVPGGMIINGNINTLGTQTALLQPTDDLPLAFIASGANGSVTSFWAEDFANLMTSNIAAIYTPLQGTNTVRIVTGNNGGNIAIYDFDNAGTFSTAGVSATGSITANTIITTPVPLANLTAVAGARAFVNNGNLAAAGNFGAQIGAGGSNVVPVWSDGSNWYIG
jgi:hypothetical protein